MALPDRIDATSYYDLDAVGFAERYDSVTFESVHPLLCRYLPTSGFALDIGAGSGRDAHALADHGLNVTAIEPSAGLRRIGKSKDRRIRWIDDRLPYLSSLADETDRYDLILCSAVLMVVPQADLVTSFATMARLLAVPGRIAINVRQPMPGESVDLFFAHSDSEILAAAAAANLTCFDLAEAGDALGRTLYRWRSFILERVR